MTKKKEQKKLEILINDLEKIVEKLEEDKLPIEEAMKKFEDGVEISKQCTDLLKALEKKMTLLLKKDGVIEEEAYELHTTNK